MGLSRSSRKAQEPCNSQVVGPFLGASPPGEIKIIIGLPHLAHPKIKCVIESVTGTTELEAPREHGLFGVYTFHFKGLTKDAEYRYRFEVGGQPIELQFGMDYADCHFSAPSEFFSEHSFISMSCHNPFETKEGSADHGWAMWNKLYQRIKSDPSIKLLVLGGDQVYNDDVEAEYISKITKNPDDTNLLNKVRERFIRQYQLYWENLEYRKVLAQIPSIAMWDDHDITDGWGGRLESFNGTEISTGWKKYFELAREAFLAYQASRNPGELPNLPNGAQSFFYDFGPNRIYMLDNRAERNSKQQILWSDTHRDICFQSLAAVPDAIRKIFVLCPTVPFRTNFDEDRRLGRWTSILFLYVQQMEKHATVRKWLLAMLILLTGTVLAGYLLAGLDYMGIINISTERVAWGKMSLFIGLIFSVPWAASMGTAGLAELILRVPELPRLTDDLEDGLSSDANRPALTELLRKLFLLRQRGVEVVVMSGDIHLAGVSEIIQITKERTTSILQVVSSPIAYQPMPKAVEGFSTTTSEMVLEDSETEQLFARNIFYISKRNFAQIFPSKIGTDEPPYIYHLEGHRCPVVIPSSFLPK